MSNLREEALEYHKLNGKPGKIAILPTKPLDTQHDLALAYSPGVAEPVLDIAEDPAKAFEYTSRGNLVAVVSNGTAILGLGNRGALASKPVPCAGSPSGPDKSNGLLFGLVQFGGRTVLVTAQTDSSVYRVHVFAQWLG